MADDLAQLEYLQLVNRIHSEVNNHLGIDDTVLAKFLISVHEKSKSLDSFKKRLAKKEANFPDAFVENIDRLILTLHPKYKKENKKVVQVVEGQDGKVVVDKQKRMFPGLALADQAWEPSVGKQQEDGKDNAVLKEVNDMMAEFEASSKKQRTRPSEAQEPAPKRQRRSPSPPRRNDYSRGRGGYDDRGPGRGGRAQVDQQPVVFKIYDGRVTGLKEFGAFVQLEGVAGRAEGIFSSIISLYTLY